MSGGHSLQSFAGEIGCSRDTLYAWEKRHPEFANAVDLGEIKCLYYWERLGIQALTSLKRFNARVWILTVRNLPAWRSMSKPP